ncbi:MAG: dienelactone hydrolase family protein [Myxococcota bacterium]
MSEERLVVDGIEALLLLPDGAGPFPLVVQYMDALGLRPALTTMGQRLVEAGYAVLQPNLYWRSGSFAPFDYATVFSDPVERPRLGALMNALTPDDAMADTAALLAHLDGDPRVLAGSVGVVGYCMGGRMAFFASSRLADRVVAAASIHGGGLVTPAENSPHLAVGQIRARLVFGVAADDASCPPVAVITLKRALTEAGVPFTVHAEATAKHGYAVPDSPVYDEAAAERHWSQVLGLFGSMLMA